MKTGILFDLDGTLLDTLADIQGGVNHTLTSLGYPERTLAEVRRFVGNGARWLMAQAVPEGGKVDAALAEFQRYYSANCQILTKPYDGYRKEKRRLQRKRFWMSPPLRFAELSEDHRRYLYSCSRAGSRYALLLFREQSASGKGGVQDICCRGCKHC